jgi:hypothetical protein
MYKPTDLSIHKINRVALRTSMWSRSRNGSRDWRIESCTSDWRILVNSEWWWWWMWLIRCWIATRVQTWTGEDLPTNVTRSWSDRPWAANFCLWTETGSAGDGKALAPEANETLPSLIPSGTDQLGPPVLHVAEETIQSSGSRIENLNFDFKQKNCSQGMICSHQINGITCGKSQYISTGHHPGAHDLQLGFSATYHRPKFCGGTPFRRCSGNQDWSMTTLPSKHITICQTESI